jgi:hypothetical protein
MNIKNLYIFGVGAAGSNTLLNLVTSLSDINITVIDFDVVEMRNISAGTQPYTKADLNRPKIQAIQRIIKMQYNKNINAINARIESVKDIEKIVANKNESLILDCFDNAKSRNLFRSLKSYNVIHVGFSGELSGEVIWNDCFEEMDATSADARIDVCQMPMAKPFISTLSGLASIVVSKFVLKSEKSNLYFDVNYNIMKWS